MKQILLVGVGLVSLVLAFTLGSVTSTTTINTYQDTTVVLNYETDLEIVKQDLITYQKFSPSTIKTVLTSIDSASRRWDIPVGLLHAIFRVESEYNFWIEHPTVTVKVYGKPTRTQAIGIGGVIWEFWSDSLKKHNIAQTRTDLYLPEVNIEASAAILRWITNTKLEKNSTTEYNLINNIISGYYGAYDKMYHKKMERITSDLWLKRIAKMLFVKNHKHEIIKSNLDTTKVTQ